MHKRSRKVWVWKCLKQLWSHKKYESTKLLSHKSRTGNLSEAKGLQLIILVLHSSWNKNKCMSLSEVLVMISTSVHIFSLLHSSNLANGFFLKNKVDVLSLPCQCTVIRNWLLHQLKKNWQFSSLNFALIWVTEGWKLNKIRNSFTFKTLHKTFIC